MICLTTGASTALYYACGVADRFTGINSRLMLSSVSNKNGPDKETDGSQSLVYPIEVSKYINNVNKNVLVFAFCLINS